MSQVSHKPYMTDWYTYMQTIKQQEWLMLTGVMKALVLSPTNETLGFHEKKFPISI